MFRRHHLLGAVVLAGICSTAHAAPSIERDLHRTLVAQRRTQGIVGVSAAVVVGGRVVFAEGVGSADLRPLRSMKPSTQLYAGSLSEIFTSVLVLALAEEGRLDLDDPVAQHVAAFDGPTTLTIRHLLSHTGGLPREGSFEYWFTAQFPDGDAIVRDTARAARHTSPGASWAYSNVGYALLGQVVEGVTGQTYAQALRERVLDPLGLADSGAPGPPADRRRLANGYSPPGRLLPDDERPFAGVGREVRGRHERLYHDAAAMTPAFGVYTTASDLVVLAAALLGHHPDVLAPARRTEMLSPQWRFPDDDKKAWGLGVKLLQTDDGHHLVRHVGWFAAHRSHVLLDPDADIGVVVMTNADDADPAAIAEALWRSTRASQNLP